MSEELAVEIEGARVLGLVDDVGRGAGRHHEAAQRHLYRLAPGTPAPVLLGLALEADRAQVPVRIGDGLDGIHARRVADAFLERLLHLFVVLAVGR